NQGLTIRPQRHGRGVQAAGHSRDDRRASMTAVPNRTDFETTHAGQAPWDIGRPQQAFPNVADRITGSVLDAGCGAGEHALFLAGRAATVTAIASREEPLRPAGGLPRRGRSTAGGP